MKYTSYHNHTKWSDGAATVQEMIDCARNAGLDEVGISDHFALALDGRRFSWGLAPESLDAYVSEIVQAKIREKSIKVLLSLEVDYFPETIDLMAGRLAEYSFDYLIGSVHFVDDFATDLNAQFWEKISQESRNRVWRGYWQRLREVAQTGLFDIIGHFDLPKKFNYHPSVDLTADALAALDAIAAADMAIELNTAGWDRPVAEAYPSVFYLKEARRRGIPLVINSDAHAAGEIVRYFDRARNLASEAGYTELACFENRNRFLEPMSL